MDHWMRWGATQRHKVTSGVDTVLINSFLRYDFHVFF